jgi:CheY-like chemotaxis protein
MGRILVADDDEVVVKLMRRVLEAAGHEVVSVADGHEALKLALSRDFDLYILDVRMPRLDGYSLSLSITKKFPERKVVLVTGLEARKFEPMAKISGASAIIPKPFDPLEFLNQIKSFLP